ncbi:MAG: carboxypeptidase regulatory-like domain-containing protein [bacterium]|nr:carboxypeptidase regulatory-like domain-containing protein [bacterium]
MEKWIKIVGGILGIIVMLLGLYFGYLHISKETVEGVVRDGVSNKPIKGATVVLEDNQFITGDEGKYYFEDMIRPGRYTITSQKDGYEDYAGAVTVKDITNHDIKMSMKGKEEGAQPAGEYKVKITTPTDGQSVDKSLVMEGLFSGIMPREKHLWVVVNPAGFVWLVASE